MRRDVMLIPLYLWVSASICVHIVSYVTTNEVAARVARGRASQAAAQGGRGAADAPPSEIEFTYIPAPQTTPAPTDEQPNPDATPSTENPRDREHAQALARMAPPPVRAPEVVPLVPPPPPTVALPAPPPPPPSSQHLQPVDQQNENNEARPDNPAFLAQSNHNVDEQTVAALRNLNHDDPHPQVGGAPTHNSATQQGNGDQSVSADNRDQQGDRRHAPGTSPDPARHPTSGPRIARIESSSGNATGVGRTLGRAGAAGAAGREGAAGTVGTTVAPTAPGLAEGTLTASDGAGGLVPLGTGIPTQSGQGGRNGEGGRNGQRGQGGDAGTRVGVRGLGAERTLDELTPDEVTYNQVYGPEAERERRVAQLRRSQARGNYTDSWRENRASIENYTPSVRVGNQTALRTAASPFAGYLTAMHRRIHRLFADGFISDLSAAPANSPLNNMSLATTVEIILERDGRVSRLGVLRTSGNTAFDVASLNSVRRAAPFGTAPPAILSGDSRVYVHWTFFRDERYCNPGSAEPFILPNPGGQPPAGTPPAPTGPAPRDEHPPMPAPSTVSQREPSTLVPAIPPITGGVASARVASR